MTGYLPYLIGAAMLGALGFVLVGVFGMARSTPNRGERANKLMQYRVVFQAVAVGLFLLFLYLTRH